MFRTLLLLLLAASVACEAPAEHTPAAAASAADGVAEDARLRARQDSMNRAQPGYVVDSILPLDEEVRRFSAVVGGAPARTFRGGATSIDALVRGFGSAVAARDTLRLAALALSAREFIDLVYPSSPYTRPPFRQSPALTWSQIQWASGKGLRRLTDRLGGRPLRIEAASCPQAPERQGRNILHVNCVVRYMSDGAPARSGRLFGSVIARDGQFKFVSYANMF